MGLMISLTLTDVREHLDTDRVGDDAWQTVVWNDPVNLMSYVAHVFREYFGFDADTASRLMLAVHHEGHAVVAHGPREQMELHTQAMHDYGLWATVRNGTSS
ncbi:ATP-dependent Clp protease adaptor protein ClpS [Microbacterium sp. AG1240]|uniref:ATP-dependent Clp protease adapter ClpS n=1 Tax=Microbacterium sp. AG1240 TaxID=2183992 RepID=UPI000F104D52|nr:ATP-dependent Clp protease adaptor protein ClpS [Microbacterium sp. AG1240]